MSQNDRPRNEVEVFLLTPEEAEEAKCATLERLGMTFEELQEEARSGRFRSERARMAWLAFVALSLAEPCGPTC